MPRMVHSALTACSAGSAADVFTRQGDVSTAWRVTELARPERCKSNGPR